MGLIKVFRKHIFVRYLTKMVEESIPVHNSLVRIQGDGAEKPLTNKHYHRLYSHNLCPFSARCRYTLAAKGIKFQECNVDLNDKKPWHVALDGSGQAPILEFTDGYTISDSGIMQQYANEAGQGQGI